MFLPVRVMPEVVNVIKSLKSLNASNYGKGKFMKILVFYYSRTGNTKFVAEKIAEKLNADLCEIVDKKNRHGRFIILTGGYAAIREKLTDIEQTKTVDNYDLVIVGSPVWAGKFTPAIRTFLVKNDLSEKQVAFFVTMGGDKPGKAIDNMKELVSAVTPLGELTLINDLKDKEEAMEQISAFCDKIKAQIG
jgi:flavodoxin